MAIAKISLSKFVKICNSSKSRREVADKTNYAYDTIRIKRRELSRNKINYKKYKTRRSTAEINGIEEEVKKDWEKGVLTIFEIARKFDLTKNQVRCCVKECAPRYKKIKPIDFMRKWNSSESLGDFCAKVGGLKSYNASIYAYRLRKRGFLLKRFSENESIDLKDIKKIRNLVAKIGVDRIKKLVLLFEKGENNGS